MLRAFQLKSIAVSSKRFTLLSSVYVLATLIGCGGGSGGGGDQDPDPVAVDLPIAYIKRPVPKDVFDLDDDNNVTEIAYDDILEPRAFNPGAKLYIRNRASASAQETNITDRAWPPGAQYDVKEVDVSSDGKKLTFAMRAPNDPDLDEDEQAKWDIWIYDFEKDELKPLLAPGEAQIGNDVSPRFLPGNMDVVYSSDRQFKSRQIRLFDGKAGFSAIHEDNNNGDPDYAFVLHRSNITAQDIEQITFNQSHDLHPAVLDNGRIMFLRWDNYPINTSGQLSLYTANPDGSDVQFFYGFHSQLTGTDDSPAVFSRPFELPDGRIMVKLRPRLDERFGGDIVFIDGENFTEVNRPTYANTGASGPGQVSASALEIKIYDVNDLTDPDDLDDPDRRISRHGRFNSASPMDDGSGRLLVSWNQCRLINPADPDQFNPTQFMACTDQNLLPNNDTGVMPHEAPPLYGLWIYNPEEGTQLPVFPPQEGFIYSDVVAMKSTNSPLFIPHVKNGVNQSLYDLGLGIVHIRSVYDMDGSDSSAAGIPSLSNPSNAAYATRPARFLRLIKAVGQPDDDELDIDNGAFGLINPRIMKDILGYVPIEPDGSAKFVIPGDMAFTIAITDATGKRLSQFRSHNVWLQVRPGESLECNGCHSPAGNAPHGRRDAEPPSANVGALTDVNFPGTQPPLRAQIGESMAETYSRVNGSPRTPSYDIVFQDEWTLGAAEVINLNYSDLTTPSPSNCDADWDALCRIRIDYPTHIQPIWEAPRVDDAMNDITCINCHNKQDPLNANAVQVPAGQLELTADGGDNSLNSNVDNNGLQSISYRDLLRQDSELELNAGGTALQRRVIVDAPAVIDPETLEIISPEINHIPQCQPSMALGSSFNSNNIAISNEDCDVIRSGRDFFTWFQPGVVAPTVDHAGFLSDAELKLISEWLDIGAQYYNNPYNAPLN